VSVLTGLLILAAIGVMAALAVLRSIARLLEIVPPPPGRGGEGLCACPPRQRRGRTLRTVCLHVSG